MKVTLCTRTRTDPPRVDIEANDVLSSPDAIDIRINMLRVAREWLREYLEKEKT